MMRLDYWLELAIEAANKASKAIMQERKNLKDWKKQDGSVLTSADLASDQILNDILGKTDIKVLSEEKILSQKESENLQTFWLIDPLDGTSGFLKGSDEFCIMISLIHENRPILSLIKSPSTEDIYYGHKKSKVYKNNQYLNIDEKQFKNNQFKALLSVNHLSKIDLEFAQKYKLEAINIGSGLKFCAILEGRAGIYRRLERLNIWDIAAGDFLVNLNGGFMGMLDKNLISYSPLEHRSQFFICVSKKNFLKDFL
ncbi:3'(2'),5'-bisphosphate nucleotidase CysQ [Campylobacter sp. 2018MI35]|nr:MULTISPECIES: inositol monophosphatase family protein [unclassified Campylobacter]MBZ7947131.1 3'(2'),5'-bisphosphate nucleotidase CysQ [Campylobacter sp. RM10536]MBZ7950053.1 3'(2'),5'-bisphosphate nucleotidase CysQ [Campylobacter sp. RM10534]MBZ7952928.1 3'(2'),5'-bisphosphate nucleotidase CysQ [Campylobacter sp. RM9939]MBZ7957426.1 3'(2'),5'-bisphosphate nucleotidase CysQ [Campylobacter sp. RM10541]MBK2000942.1 3'(2'),5'-bisphosphate nucleotidase CysQ [Campylobacter sp. 2018MI35]